MISYDAHRVWSGPSGSRLLTESQQRKVDDGNDFARFVAKVCKRCLEKGIHLCSENPVTAFIWNSPEVVEIARSHRVGFGTVDFCAFGTCWRKRTKFMTTAGLQN